MIPAFSPAKNHNTDHNAGFLPCTFSEKVQGEKEGYCANVVQGWQGARCFLRPKNKSEIITLNFFRGLVPQLAATSHTSPFLTATGSERS